MVSLSLPGIIDAHVHLRDPGATHKEDAYSGTVAALAGGIIGVLDMPNNTPPTVDRRTFLQKREILERKAVSDYGLFLGYDGRSIAPLLELGGQAVGLKLYLDETFGDLTTEEPESLASAFEAWPGPGPIAVHVEDAAQPPESDSIDVALILAHRYDQPLHVCHVPQPDDLLRIERARQQGVRVTCEVTPHHLFLSTDDLPRLGAYGQMKPPLISPADVARFWQRLNLVDIIATDHAPHTRAEKESTDPPPGVPGLETMLPLLLRAVDEERLTLERMVELTYHNPLQIYGLRPPEDSGVEVEMGARYRLPAGGYQTRCGWSPFAGQWAMGRVTRVRLRGEVVWEEGRVLVQPGYGRALARGWARHG